MSMVIPGRNVRRDPGPEAHRMNDAGTAHATDPANGGPSNTATGSGDLQASRRPRRGTRAVRAATRVLAVVGLLTIVGLVVGVVADFRSFDRTSGGYEAPYTGWTGTPIDWDAADITDDGFRTNGYVTDVTTNCTTGMITFHVFGLTYDWRTFSGRALAVHKPREACTAAGFTPRF